MARTRIDILLVERGLAPTRQKAQAMLLAGAVLVDDRPVDKPGTLVSSEAAVRVRGNPIPYVSRGGLKLEHALDRFGIDPTGLRVLDAGISTGGFADCLLQRGAAHIYGVDVGKAQVAWEIRQNPAVTLFEGTNVREFDVARLGDPVDLVVADLSFISLTLVLPVLHAALRPDGIALPMVKPQFEVGREHIGRKGVVRDETLRLAAVDKVVRASLECGFAHLGTTPSPVPGPEGNIEYFLHLRRAATSASPAVGGERGEPTCPRRTSS
ncbi:MAG: TlyA family RNA methyltransferase [Deltaproteobacteria bacterium]|nr:TlyA family RNA methyltransferase [Deltaproteobacteria bacterium]